MSQVPLAVVPPSKVKYHKNIQRLKGGKGVSPFLTSFLSIKETLPKGPQQDFPSSSFAGIAQMPFPKLKKQRVIKYPYPALPSGAQNGIQNLVNCIAAQYLNKPGGGGVNKYEKGRSTFR